LSFINCVVCSFSIYGFWLPLWYLQTLRNVYGSINVVRSLNGFYRVAVAVQRQRVIYTDYSGFASPALGSPHFHVSWLSDFIFYQKPLYNFM
jgi:hypothetical protein